MVKTKTKIILTLFAVLLLALIIWVIWANKALELNTYTVASEKLPDAFDGYRIAHVSDLHNAQMGKDNEKLLDMLRQAQPDLIAITGDIIDSRNTKTDVALHFVREAVKIAPCYYVTGNHEARVPEYAELKLAMEEAGVSVLENEQAYVTVNGETICLLGLDDPSFETEYIGGDDVTIVKDKLATLYTDTDTFTVLLSHRPELFETYAASGVDLVLSGHAHGGQVRIPFLGGLVAPNQGLFPTYDAGSFQQGSTTMIVSRGIGNSIIPLRINNRPEVVIVELK